MHTGSESDFSNIRRTHPHVRSFVRAALLLLACETLMPPLAAQGLNKQAYYLMVAPDKYIPNPSGAFRFRAFITFTLTSAKFTNSFTLPDGSTRTIPNTGSS